MDSFKESAIGVLVADLYPGLWTAENPAPGTPPGKKQKPERREIREITIKKWFESAKLKPEYFTELVQEDRYNKHYAVAVAMAYGWLPSEAECHECHGTMRLGPSSNYKDELSWICRNSIAWGERSSFT